MSYSLSRRQFLSATAGVMVAPIFLTPWVRAQSAQGLLQLSSPYDKAQLRALAARALEAAKAAGASFADVRIMTARIMRWRQSGSIPHLDSMHVGVRIGVRAFAGGGQGFASDVLHVDPDKVAGLGRLAVARARGMGGGGLTSELAPAPAVTGEWSTPVEIDPFEVPLGEHEAALSEINAAVLQTAPGSQATISANWLRQDVLFASTEGSLIEQRHYWASTQRSVSLEKMRWHSRNNGGTYGYEWLREARRLRVEEAQTVAQWAKLPSRSVDVGRYDVVLSAEAVGMVLEATVGGPLRLDRALMQAPAVYGARQLSYAMPPAEALGNFQLGSELIQITADRSRPGFGATVGWDSEGVKPEDFTLVKDGVVVDYLTTRDTAPALRDVYARRNQTVRSHGCASAIGAGPPVVALPNLALQPGKSAVSEEDMIRDIKRGFYIGTLESPAGPDHYGLNTMIVPRARSIVDGKLGDVMKDIALQFNTSQFWQSVDAIGGVGTERPVLIYPNINGGLDSMIVPSHSAVPLRARRVNVTNIGKKG